MQQQAEDSVVQRVGLHELSDPGVLVGQAGSTRPRSLPSSRSSSSRNTCKPSAGPSPLRTTFSSSRSISVRRDRSRGLRLQQQPVFLDACDTWAPSRGELVRNIPRQSPLRGKDVAVEPHGPFDPGVLLAYPLMRRLISALGDLPLFQVEFSDVDLPPDLFAFCAFNFPPRASCLRLVVIPPPR